MAQATLTLIGMYNFDDTLFSEMSLPSGIDQEIVINTILQRSGEFEVLYPDLDFMKSMIGLVSNKWNRTFSKWYNALQLTYNPIHNYDRYEEWTDAGTDSGTSKSNEDSSGNGQTDTFVNSYDNDTLVEDGQSKSSQSATSSGTDTHDYKTSGTHSGHMYGNIGVTTSQQMLESELDLASWNLYEHIADIFVEELCIPVYG